MGERILNDSRRESLSSPWKVRKQS